MIQAKLIPFQNFKSIIKNYYFQVFTPIPLFWLVFYALGFPPPMDDDLFFIGAAINLAKTGNFVNPLLALWSDRAIDRFYVQPPFHSHILGFWLQLFGVNTASLLAFQVFCYFVFSVFLALLLKRYKFPWFTPLAITLCYGLFMFGFGLRQDGISMAFLALGLWLISYDQYLAYFFGFVCLGSSILSLPVNMVIAIPFGLGILIRNFWSIKDAPVTLKKHLFYTSMIWGLAVLFTFFILLLSINFELSRFLSDLSWCASLRRQPISNLIPSIIWQISIGAGKMIYGSLYGLLLAVEILVLINYKKQENLIKGFLVISNISLGTMLIAYSNVLGTNFNFFCWVCVIILLSKSTLPAISRKILGLMAAVIVFINYSPTFLTLFFQDRTVSTSVQEAKEFVEAHPNTAYWVDSIAARFVFDYDIPEGSVGWEFSSGSVFFLPSSVAQKPPDMVWIIGTKQAWHIPDELPDYPRLQVFGREFQSIARKPYDVLIIE
ncbi:ArnT family glycosyltransferase [Spirulina subsalsa]|uniref:ArnT family glycosyltransferase n=1 Tax=Spirulina subsalsa TaxID=54311 RepID=UPI0002FDA8D4|nr:hypothetical protein [Spirulina subsalsa]